MYWYIMLGSFEFFEQIKTTIKKAIEEKNLDSNSGMVKWRIRWGIGDEVEGKLDNKLEGWGGGLVVRQDIIGYMWIVKKK